LGVAQIKVVFMARKHQGYDGRMRWISTVVRIFRLTVRSKLDVAGDSLVFDLIDAGLPAI
jgi:hypothetical protein